MVQTLRTQETKDRFVVVNGARLDVQEQGEGDPVLHIHGSILADAFQPLLTVPTYAKGRRLIAYRRRGYGRSERAPPAYPIKKQGDDAAGLLDALGVKRAHVVGHSYGAVIALQLSSARPELVRTLTLLEPPILHAIPSGAQFGASLQPVVELFAQGKPEAAIDAFLGSVIGPTFKQLLKERLPKDALRSAYADAATFFESELAGLEGWTFDIGAARKYRGPVLSIVGEKTQLPFLEVATLLRAWFPSVKTVSIAGATHGLQMMEPVAVASAIVAAQRGSPPP